MGTILIVDENEEYRDHIYRFLNGLDYSVGLAFGYESAIGLLDSQTFDIALIDSKIVDGDIRSLIGEIRKRAPLTSILVMHGGPGL